MPDRPPAALVTGSSRGAGRGIALALGAHGCTVCVTGRSRQSGDHPLPGTFCETADAVAAAGGKGIAVASDHSDEVQVEVLFARIRSEQGRLDILVSNAAAVCDELTMPGNFWEKPLKMADMIDVGIRSRYVASWHAAPMMIEQGPDGKLGGLIIFTSASGAVHYSPGPAYGAHKASLDKMACDMSVDFKHADAKVAAISIWMGAVLTERLKMVIASDREKFWGARGHFREPGVHRPYRLGAAQRSIRYGKGGTDLYRRRTGQRIWHSGRRARCRVLPRYAWRRAVCLLSGGNPVRGSLPETRIFAR
jgi:NAD(P)-dependent dehydrogenase (short-subunit alcohol dehydrogenase family)